MKKQRIIFFIILILYLVICFTFFKYDKYKQDLLPLGYDNLSRIYKHGNDKIVRVYKSDEAIVQIVETVGYHEGLVFAVSILDDTIEGVYILNNNETPDYGGDYLEEKWFLDRFILPIDEKLERVKLSKSKENQVIAITGATITTDAVIDGVNLCIDNYWRIK